MISAPFHMCVLLLSAHSSKVLILSFTRVRNSGCAVEAPVKQSGLVDQVTRVLKRERMRWEEFWLQLNTQRSSYCRTCSYRRLGTSDEEHRVSGGFASLGTIPPYYCSTSFPDWTPCACCHSLPAAGGMKISMWPSVHGICESYYSDAATWSQLSLSCFDWPVMASTMGQDVSF
jgi:hypothetical protein